jgi:hypothetical protein
MVARARHSGMFLAGIQGIWQLNLANLYAGITKPLSIFTFRKGMRSYESEIVLSNTIGQTS